MKTVTRKQLTGMGASKYQAQMVTLTLKPICKQGQTNVYDLFDVSDCCREATENKRLRLPTRDALQALRWKILTFAETIVDAPFGTTVLEQIEQAERLSHRADALFAEAQAQERHLKQKRKVASLENWKNV